MTNFCQTCKWWASQPLPTNPPTDERICMQSLRTDFGAYGQDGKAIIVHRTFGCNAWAPHPDPLPIALLTPQRGEGGKV